MKHQRAREISKIAARRKMWDTLEELAKFRSLEESGKEDNTNPNLPCPPVLWREVGGNEPAIHPGFSHDNGVKCLT